MSLFLAKANEKQKKINEFFNVLVFFFRILFRTSDKQLCFNIVDLSLSNLNSLIRKGLRKAEFIKLNNFGIFIIFISEISIKDTIL